MDNQYVPFLSYLWGMSQILLNKARVGVVLHVIARHEMFQMIERGARSVYKLQHIHLKYVHLQQQWNGFRFTSYSHTFCLILFNLPNLNQHYDTFIYHLPMPCTGT